MQGSPLIVMGLDVGDPDQLMRWAEAGHLPVLLGLMARGLVGRMAGPEMTLEHPVWTTVFSGRSLGEHGYFYYRRLKPGTYELQTVTGADIGAAPFWSAFSDGSRRCAILDAPDAPIVSGLDGVQLTDWAIHNAPFAPKTEPASLMADVTKAGGPWTPIDEALESGIEVDRALYRKLLDRVKRKGAVCRELLARGPFDLVVAVFSDCHTATHQFWKYRPEAGGPETDLRHATRSIYEAIDAEIASLLAMSPPDANVFVVGSTGMLDLYPAGDLMEPFCRLLGYQASPAPSAPSMHPMAIARRLIPETLRIAISRHFPRDVRERLMSDQFRAATDWSRTTAFALPSAYTGFIRVNLRGRDPQGTVSAGADCEALLDRIEADLWKLTNPETGACPIASVTRTTRMFSPASPHLPDMLVEWKPSRRFIDRLAHPAGDIRQKKPEFFRDSDHSRAGFVAAAGPSIEPGDIGAISPLDLAPTFLALLARADAGPARPDVGPNFSSADGSADNPLLRHVTLPASPPVPEPAASPR